VAGALAVSLLLCSPPCPLSSLLQMDEMLKDPASLAELEEIKSEEDSGRRAAPEGQKSKQVHQHPASRCGCTVLTAAVDRDILTVANLGDCRAVLSQGGAAVRLTEDHKPTNRKEFERIRAAGGAVASNGRIQNSLNVSRGLGDLRFKGDSRRLATQQIVSPNPDILCRHLQCDDEFLVLASDGVWECIGDQDCVDFLRSGLLCEGGDPSKALIELLDRCVASDRESLEKRRYRGGDNMTCIVLVFGSPPSLQ